ncbi:hypothetical protein RJ639_016164 [Escallonia herrerae]|uniref:CCHC-type domain-containing protein n=1 Tax=Escallonia herrerae TaxID=1293975 RepID=A0AA89ANB3_9ASTE|nr:hypothetical protein RJ639_016164 [Escallonia herrerae]
MARGQSTYHARSRNKARSKSQSKIRKLKCYHCHKEGHYRKDCPELNGKKKDNSKTADAGVVEDYSDGADVLFGTINSLDVDMGCSHHIYRVSGGVMRIVKGALVVMKGLKQNSLDLLQEGHGCAEKQGLLGSKKKGNLDFCSIVSSKRNARDMTFDESSILLKKEVLIDTRKDHGAREKVELEVRALDSLTKISTDKEDSSHSTEENEETYNL